jgi:pentatricopeptide repeat protein
MAERDLVSWNVMITGYTHHGYVDEALELFEIMPQRNVVSWTALIAGYAHHGRLDEAVELFRKMPRKMWSHGIQ